MNKRSEGLQVIFSVFLGLMVVAFVGVGVYTFHPTPSPDPRLEEIADEERELNRPGRTELTAEQSERQRALSDERSALWDASRQERDAWGRRTSVILIAIATLIMAVSLIRSDQLPVISNGLLLGGVFTMVYGVGWIVSTETALSRFIVITIALVLTIAIGYLRFVRRSGDTVLNQPGVVNADTEDLERRMRALEERMERAARMLGGDEEGR